MEKRIIQMNEVIGGVRFINLPLVISENGAAGFPLTSWAIAEDIAESIPDHVRPFVVVDFETVDRKAMLQRLNGDAKLEYHENAEQKLLDYIYGE